jgi:hypothetical protein
MRLEAASVGLFFADWHERPAGRVCAESTYGRQDHFRLILALSQETAFGNRRPACPALDAISFVATE